MMCKHKTHNKDCSTCRTRLYRQNNPIESCYQNLRANSKRRSIEFTITLEEFKSFCIKTEYIIKRGRTKTSYHIDRKENSKGYTINNIRLLDCSSNSRKSVLERMVLKYRYNGDTKKMDFWTEKLNRFEQEITDKPY